jgi:hypothetical protein
MAGSSLDLLQQKLLAEALELSLSLSIDGDNSPEWRERCQTRLIQIQLALKNYAHSVCRDRLAVEVIPLAIREAFVRAILQVIRYPQLGAARWHSTMTSPTLSQYCPDSSPTISLPDEASYLQQLGQTFNLSSTFQAQLLEKLENVDRFVVQQKRIMSAVLAQQSDLPIQQTEAAILFNYLFDALPIPASEIHLLHTDTQIYFCIDFQDEKLCNAKVWENLTDAQRLRIQIFLKSLKTFSFEQFERFPVFGPCQPEGIDSVWLEQLAKQVAIPAAQIMQTLARSVSIVATQTAESFLVHDIWGHHWQLVLTSFRGDYRTLSSCGEPLRASETAYTPHGPLTCREIFALVENEVQVDEDLAQLFFHSEVRQRLGAIFIHLIGEMMADMAEFKFIWDNPQSVEQLPSSSLFKAHPTKLDLTLFDLNFLFLRVLQPLLDIHLSVSEDSPLEADLLTDWLQTPSVGGSLRLRVSLKQAIARLYSIFLEQYKANYLPTLDGEIGAFAEIASNLLYLQNIVNELYTDFSAETDPPLPFQDLLMVFIGSYCAVDSYAEFWDIDDVLAAYFLPCWHLWMR